MKKTIIASACILIASLSLSCDEWLNPNTQDNTQQPTVCSNEIVCKGNAVMVCRNGQWLEERICTGETPYCDILGDEYCVDELSCEENQTECVGTTLQICTQGAWQIAEENAAQCRAQIEPTYTTIAAIHQAYDDIVDADCKNNDGFTSKPYGAKITGAVTGILADKTGFFIQEASNDGKYAGMFVYCPTKKCVSGLKIGDNVTVESDGVGQFRCQLMVKSTNHNDDSFLTVTKQSDKSIVITPTVVKASQITKDGPKSPYNGALVTVSNIIPVTYQPNYAGWQTSAGNVTLYIAGLMINTQQTMVTGFPYTVTGNVYYLSYQSVLAPRSAEDIR